MTFRWLVRLASWLDLHFPPKVVVTQEIFDGLQLKEHKHSEEIARLQGEDLVVKARIAALEKSLAALKDGIATGKVPTGPAGKDRLREEFVKGEGEAWGRPQSPVVPAGA